MFQQTEYDGVKYAFKSRLINSKPTILPQEEVQGFGGMAGATSGAAGMAGVIAHGSGSAECAAALGSSIHHCMLQRGCVLREQALRLGHVCRGGQWCGGKGSRDGGEGGLQEGGADARDVLLGDCEAELRALVGQLLTAPAAASLAGGSLRQEQDGGTSGLTAQALCSPSAHTDKLLPDASAAVVHTLVQGGVGNAGGGGRCISHAAAAAVAAVSTLTHPLSPPSAAQTVDATLAPTHNSSQLSTHKASRSHHTAVRCSIPPRPPSLLPLAWGGALHVLAVWAAWADPRALTATLQLLLASCVEGKLLQEVSTTASLVSSGQRGRGSYESGTGSSGGGGGGSVEDGGMLGQLCDAGGKLLGLAEVQALPEVGLPIYDSFPVWGSVMQACVGLW